MSGASEYLPLPPWPWRDGKPLGEIAKTRSDLRVGIYAFERDVNHRVYPQRVDGHRNISGPMSQRHTFVPRLIEGETSRSWIVGWGKSKISKSDPRALYGLDDVEDALWIDTYRHRIADRVRFCGDAATLRRIAAELGFDPEATP